jgi:hypothetical protein
MSRSRQKRRGFPAGPVGPRRGVEGTLNGRPVYDGHMIEAVPAIGGTLLVVGVGPGGREPRAFACMCPHMAMELAEELRALAMEHIAQCRHEGP